MCSDSESDESDILPPKRQKRNALESDSESDFEVRNEKDITTSGVTVELINAASITEVTDLFSFICFLNQFVPLPNEIIA